MENFPQSEFFEKSKHPIFTNSKNQISEIQIPKSNIFEFPAFGFFHILVFGIQFSKKYFFEKLTFTKNLFRILIKFRKSPCLEFQIFEFWNSKNFSKKLLFRKNQTSLLICKNLQTRKDFFSSSICFKLICSKCKTSLLYVDIGKSPP